MHGPLPTIPGIKCEPDLARQFRQEVANLLGRNNTNFPGAQPISFESSHLDLLCSEDYFLCEKTDGIRLLLYCTDDGQDGEIHYLIDRKNEYYFVEHISLPHHTDTTFRKWHNQTLLDGELVLDRHKENGVERIIPRYLVFDCIMLDGENLTQKAFDKRIGRFQMFVEKPLKAMLKAQPHRIAKMPFEIVMKVMDKPYALDEMFQLKLPSLPHGNDGLVFTAKGGLYKFGTDEQILKWKPANENSVDFKLQLGAFPQYDPGDGQGLADDYDAKPIINLLIFHGHGDYRKFTTLRYTDQDWEKLKSLGQVLDGRVIECYVDDEGHWCFKKEPDGAPRFRDDKPEANHVSTMDKVIKSIKDGVSEQDLREASGRIKDAWKRRHPEESRGPPPGPHGQANGR